MTELSPARFVLHCLFAPAERGLLRRMLRRHRPEGRRPAGARRRSATF